MSILKPRKPRQPFQEVNLGHNNEEEDTTEVRRRRVSFAGINKIKEFNSDAESVVICDTPAYEEEFTPSTDSSQILKDLSHPASLINSDMNISCRDMVTSDMNPSCKDMDNSDMNISCRDMGSSFVQDDAAYRIPGTFVHSVDCNYYQDSIDLTEIISPRDDCNASNIDTSNMVISEDTMAIPKIIPGMQSAIRNDMFNRSTKPVPNVELSDLSDMDMTETNVDKENLYIDRSQNLEGFNKSVKSQATNDFYYNQSAKSQTLLNCSSMDIIQSHPNSLKKDPSATLPPSLSDHIRAENILNNRSPAHKRYRLSEPSLNPTVNQICFPSEINSKLTSSSLSNSGLIDRTIPKYPNSTDQNKHISNSSHINESIMKCSHISYKDKGNRSSILPNSQDNDCKSFSLQHPNVGNEFQVISDKLLLSDMLLSPCADRPRDMFVHSQRYDVPKDCSGEDMNISCITEGIQNKIPEQENNANSNCNIFQRHSLSSGLSSEDKNDVKSNKSTVVSVSQHFPNSSSDMDLTKMQSKYLKGIGNESEMNSVNVSKPETDDVLLLNTLRNDSKRKLDELKQGEITLPNMIHESRVDRVYSDSHRSSICDQSEIYDPVRNNPNRRSLNPLLISNNTSADCLRNLTSNDNLVHDVKPVQNNSDSLIAHKLELDLNQRSVIELSAFKSSLPDLCDKSCPLSDDMNQKTSTQNINSDSPSYEKSSVSMELEELSRDPIIEVAPLQDDDSIKFNNFISVANDAVATEINLNCDFNSNESLPVIGDSDNVSLTPIQVPEVVQVVSESISDVFPSPDTTIKNETDASDETSELNNLKPSNSSKLTNKDGMTLAEESKSEVSPESKIELSIQRNMTVNPILNVSSENAPTYWEESKSVIDESHMDITEEIMNENVLNDDKIPEPTSSKKVGFHLSEDKIPGQVLSSLQTFNKDFMEDLDYHYYEWTEWRKSFFHKFITLSIKVPYQQFTSRTPILEISLTPSDRAKNMAQKFCTREIISKINGSRCLKRTKFLCDSEKLFSYITDICKKIDSFYQSLLLLVLYYPIDLVNDSRLDFSIVDLKSYTVFTVQIMINNWECLSANNISVINQVGKISVKRVRDIFSIIPPRRERFYDFVCALQHLVL